MTSPSLRLSSDDAFANADMMSVYARLAKWYNAPSIIWKMPLEEIDWDSIDFALPSIRVAYSTEPPAPVIIRRASWFSQSPE